MAWARKLQLLRRDQSGATAVEAAFVFPIIIMTLLSFLMLGAYFQGIHNAKRTTESVARQVRLMSMPDKTTIENLLTAELSKPMVGTYSPSVTIDDKHVGGSIARINITYSYQLGIPSAHGNKVYGLNLKSVSDTQVKLRTMPTAS